MNRAKLTSYFLIIFLSIYPSYLAAKSESDFKSRILKQICQECTLAKNALIKVINRKTLLAAEKKALLICGKQFLIITGSIVSPVLIVRQIQTKKILPLPPAPPMPPIGEKKSPSMPNNDLGINNASLEKQVRSTSPYRKGGSVRPESTQERPDFLKDIESGTGSLRLKKVESKKKDSVELSKLGDSPLSAITRSEKTTDKMFQRVQEQQKEEESQLEDVERSDDEWKVEESPQRKRSSSQPPADENQKKEVFQQPSEKTRTYIPSEKRGTSLQARLAKLKQAGLSDKG